MRKKWTLITNRNNYLEIIGIITDMFRPQKTLEKARFKIGQNSGPSSGVIW
jgi:hypothetical protein